MHICEHKHLKDAACVLRKLIKRPRECLQLVRAHPPPTSLLCVKHAFIFSLAGVQRHLVAAAFLGCGSEYLNRVDWNALNVSSS